MQLKKKNRIYEQSRMWLAGISPDFPQFGIDFLKVLDRLVFLRFWSVKDFQCISDMFCIKGHHIMCGTGLQSIDCEIIFTMIGILLRIFYGINY